MAGTDEGLRTCIEWIDLISEFRQQRGAFIETAVHVADNVEGSVIGSDIGPKRRPLYNRRIHLRRRFHDVNLPETLLPQAAQAAPQGL